MPGKGSGGLTPTDGDSEMDPKDPLGLFELVAAVFTYRRVVAIFRSALTSECKAGNMTEMFQSPPNKLRQSPSIRMTHNIHDGTAPAAKTQSRAHHSSPPSDKQKRSYNPPQQSLQSRLTPSRVSFNLSRSLAHYPLPSCP